MCLVATFVGEPDAGKPHVRSDERDVETEHGTAIEAPPDERGGNRQALPTPPRHISTLPALLLPVVAWGFAQPAVQSLRLLGKEITSVAPSLLVRKCPTVI